MLNAGRAFFENPIVRLELRRLRRRHWWPRWPVFLLYTALLGAAVVCGIALLVGCGLVLARSDWEQVLTGSDLPDAQIAAGATAGVVVCLGGGLAGILRWILPWIAPVLTATTIAREREMRTFELLQATLLSERSIVLGKLVSRLLWLWPGAVALVLLMPFQLISTAGGGLFAVPLGGLGSPLLWLLLGTEGSANVGWLVVTLLVAGVAGPLKPWADLALHATIGLSASALVRSSGMAVAIAYGAILTVRATLWLASSLLTPVLLMLSFDWADPMTAATEYALLVPGLLSLAALLIEFAGAAFLVWGVIWWLKRT